MTRPTFTLLLAAVPLAAQSNSPEVFASIGAFSINGDEGSIGRTVSYSSGVSVPFFRNWFAELDVLTGKVTGEHPGGPDNFYRTRRTLVIASVVRRWCNRRACLFAGSGVGIQRRDSVTRSDRFAADYAPQAWQIAKKLYDTCYNDEDLREFLTEFFKVAEQAAA